MSDLLSIGLSGLTASRIRALASANNLANLNTPGYHSQRASTASLAGGNGAAIQSLSSSSIPGSFIPTGNPLDLAINGNGYFQVTDGQGNNYFTRDGSFSPRAGGQLANGQGFALNPGVTIPVNAENVATGSDGTVSGRVNSQTVEFGTIQLAQFSNPDGLSSQGGNLQTATGASGIPQMGAPGEGGRGFLLSGFLEGSNVDAAREAISLRMEENAFKANAVVIRTGDEMQRETIDLIG